jgi:hypothetical protein
LLVKKHDEMLETFAKVAFSALGGLIGLVLNKPRIRILCNWQNYPNGNEACNYLGLAVKIANTGAKTLYFERLVLVRKGDETYFPIFWGVLPGAELKPNSSLVGHIPVGHIANQQVVEIRIFDAVERIFRLRGKKLSIVLKSLEQEKERLEQLGFNVHPTSGASSQSSTW